MREEITYFAAPERALPLYISIAGISYCDGSYHIQRYDSGCTVIEYVISGSGTVSNGERTYTASANDIYIMRQNGTQDYYSDASDPWVKMFLNIRGPLFEQLLDAYGFSMDTVINADGMEADFRRMIDIAFDRTKDDQEIFSRIAVELFAIVVRLSAKKRSSAPLSEAGKIKKYIDENLNRIVSNKELSDLIHRCEDYCIKRFREEYGKAPYEYQTERKMSAAKTLLKNTNLSVGEISDSLGYCDQHYFSNIFKKKCGASPSKYREV